MASTVIVDYGLGNIFSIRNACEKVGLEVVVSSEPDRIRECRQLILPGVGAFGAAMANLKRLGLCQPLLDHAGQGKPLLGICLGLQLLFSSSEEFGSNQGLGIIPGSVRRFPSTHQGVALRIPHVGWNGVRLTPKQEPLFSHFREDSCAYFVHSFYVEPQDPSLVTARARYQGFDFCAAVRSGNIVGIQFHPEKSGPLGLQILANLKNGVWE